MTRSALCGKCGLRGLHRRPGSGGAEVRIGPGQSFGEADGGVAAEGVQAGDVEQLAWRAVGFAGVEFDATAVADDAGDGLASSPDGDILAVPTLMCESMGWVCAS
jgi:hypothetical protein